MTAGEFLSFFTAAFLTLAIFSFLYKDNPVYKFAEHLFVGVAAGYYIVLQYKDAFIPHFWNHLQGDEPLKWLRLGAGLMGFLILLHLWPRASWLARWPIAFLVGAYAGLQLVGTMQADVMTQVDNLMAPVWKEGMPVFSYREESVSGNILIVIGVVSVLVYFLFSRERGPVLGALSRVGMVFLMVTFGAAFGFAVLGRVSLLIGRARALQEYSWATLVAAPLVVGLIVAGEVRERRRKRSEPVEE